MTPDLLVVVLVVARLAVGVWLFATPSRLRPRAAPGEPPDLAAVAVVIPARDEAGSLPRLLPSLPPDVDVVVVDDDSSDGTAEVARSHGVRVVASAPLPSGWTGKAWACAQGAAATTAPTLAFVDADVRFAAGGFAAVLDAHRAAGGLTSVQPHHTPERPVEHLAALCNAVAVAGTDAATPLGRRRGGRGAFGPVLVSGRTDYDAVGGHEAVRASVVDDVALAERYRATGRPVHIHLGDGAVAFRMYPEGLGQLVEGFAKNLASGARGVRATTVALVAWWLSLLVQASVAPVAAVVTGRWAWAAVLYGVVVTQVWWVVRRVGRFAPWTALAFPVLLVVFLGVFAASVWRTWRGTVRWRGREVRTRPDR